MSYFYQCSYPLEVGSVILPGNWGRIVSRYAINQDLALARRALVEVVFEHIRCIEFPERPSRREATFLCESEPDLTAFRNVTNRYWDVAYEVELVDASTALHRASLDHFDMAWGENATLATVEVAARMYWRGGEALPRPEVLTKSPIRITRQIG